MRSLLSIVFLSLSLTSFSISFSYSSGPNLNTKRHLHQSQRLNDGRIIVFGGYDGYLFDPTYYKSTEIYDPSLNKWSSGPDMITERYNHKSVLMSDGRVMTIGGSYLNYDAEIFNGETNSWSTINGPSIIFNNIDFVCLKDGRILAVGIGIDENFHAEIYMPSLNKWINGNALNKQHGAGYSLTLLSSGKVIIIGGSTSQKSIEIFNPLTNSWEELGLETVHNRYNHSALELENGNILITGGSDLSNAKFTEILNIETQTVISSTVKMAVSTNFSPMVLLDNGNPFIYGIGDIVSTNQKSFQEYNTSTNTWDYSNNTGIGVNGYTIHRLDNGKFMIIGGNGILGNGASEKTILIDQTGGNPCTPPLLYHSISTTSDCYGKDVSVSISYSYWGANYSLWKGNNKISSNYSGTANVLNIPMNINQVSSGTNKLRVGVKQDGCPILFMNSEIEFDLPITNNTIPAIEILAGDTITCSIDSVLVGVSNPSQNVIWFDGQEGNSAYIKGFKSIYAKYESNGCLSKPSNNLNTRKITETDISLTGNPREICSSETIDLLAQPTGGSWSGSGVINDTQFKAPGTWGHRSISYTYCDIIKRLNIELQDVNKVKFNPLEDLTIYPDSTIELCGGRPRSIDFNDIEEYETYSVFFNDSLVYSEKGDGYHSRSADIANDSTGVITVLIESPLSSNSHLCPIDSVITTFSSRALKSPKSDYEIIYPDTFCIGEKAKIYIINPDTNAYFKTSYAKLVSMNIDTLKFELDITYTNNYFSVSVTNNETCSSSKRLVDDKIIGNTLNARFNNEPFVKIGDTVKFENVSQANKYEWNFEGSISHNLDFDTVLNQGGAYSMRLIGSLNQGCSDTAYSTVYAYEETPTSNVSPCYWDTLKIDLSQLENQKIHIDKQGNKYVYGSAYASRNGASYSGSYAWVLAKFDANWNLEWINRMDTSTSAQYSDFYSVFINAIDTDDDGNVYIAGSFAGEKLQFENYDIKRNLRFISNGPIMGKINPQGKFEWFYYNEVEYDDQSRYDDKRVGTDVLYHNGNAYFSIIGLGKGYYKSPGGDSLPIPLDSNLNWLRFYNGVVELNAAGNYVNTFKASEFIASTNYLNPSSSAILTKRLQYDYPELILSGENQITYKGQTQGRSNSEVNDESLYSKEYLNDNIGYAIKLNLTNQDWEPGVKVFENLPNGNWITDKKGGYFQFSNFSTGTTGAEFEYTDGEYFDFSKNTQSRTTCLISSMNDDGSFNWQKEISGLVATKMSFDSLNSRIIVSGTYRDGVHYDGFGYKANEWDDLIVLVLDLNANLIFAENISANNIIQSTDHYLTDCGDLIVSMEGKNLSHQNDSLKRSRWNPIIFEIPIGSEICNSDCHLVTKTKNISSIRNFTLFPNPATNTVNISGDLKDYYQVRDITGKLVIDKTKGNSIDISTIKPGMYFVSILENNRKIQTMKFEKIK